MDMVLPDPPSWGECDYIHYQVGILLQPWPPAGAEGISKLHKHVVQSPTPLHTLLPLFPCGEFFLVCWLGKKSPRVCFTDGLAQHGRANWCAGMLVCCSIPAMSGKFQEDHAARRAPQKPEGQTGD